MFHPPEDSTVPFYKFLGEIMAVWALINIGFYTLLPLLGISLSYNISPYKITAYFLLSAIFTIIYFWDIYKRGFKKDTKVWIYGLTSLGAVLLLWIFVYFFSLLPNISGKNLSAFTDILFATPWYFLPKSVDILIQQLLISVLVLELSIRFVSLKNVMIGYALCFGGAHIILFALNGSPMPYSLFMTLCAFLSTLFFPYLILNVRGGFVYAYIIHFIFYVILATVLHILPPVGYVI